MVCGCTFSLLARQTSLLEETVFLSAELTQNGDDLQEPEPVHHEFQILKSVAGHVHETCDLKQITLQKMEGDTKWLL